MALDLEKIYAAGISNIFSDIIIHFKIMYFSSTTNHLVNIYRNTSPTLPSHVFRFSTCICWLMLTCESTISKFRAKSFMRFLPWRHTARPVKNSKIIESDLKMIHWFGWAIKFLFIKKHKSWIKPSLCFKKKVKYFSPEVTFAVLLTSLDYTRQPKFSWRRPNRLSPSFCRGT